MTAATPALRLDFSLPGEWISLDPTGDAAQTHEAVRDIARQVVGPADDAALARRCVEDGLLQAAEAARNAQAESLLICREVTPGVPTPVALTVHAPRGLRIGPALGTAPERVMAAFVDSLAELSTPGLDTAERLEIPGSQILRLHDVEPQEVEDDGGRFVQNRLAARYWYTVPQSKQIVLVQLTTPLGDIPQLMLRFFDAIVVGSRWRPGKPGGISTAAEA